MYEEGILERRWIKSSELYPDQNSISVEFLDEVCIMFGVNNEILSKIKKDKQERSLFENNEGEEFFETYPNSTNGFTLKACNAIIVNGKTYEGKSDIIKLYCEMVDYCKQKHNEVIKKIRHDIQHGSSMCNVKITTFVRDKLWEQIKIIQWTNQV
jgi:hypothetical protein